MLLAASNADKSALSLVTALQSAGRLQSGSKMLADSHAHIDDERFDADREEVVARALAAGVSLIVNIGADMASSARSVALAEKYPGIYAAVRYASP